MHILTLLHVSGLCHTPLTPLSACPRPPVGPHDHDPAGSVPAVGRGGETRSVALRVDGSHRVLHGNAPLYQPPLQRWQLLPALFTAPKDPPEK